MSTATAVEAPAPAKGKKKLIIIVAVAALLVLGVGGGAAALLLKKNADAAYAEGEDEESAPAAARRHSGAAPLFVPLDPFTVNLADRQADRYAQVGVTLEIDDAKTADQIKAFMPAVRNNVLMAIGDRTAAELLGREGKAMLAERIKRETSRALGYEIGDEDLAPEAEAEDAAPAKGKQQRKPAAPALPVKAVHFSNFIIQ